MSTQSWLMKTEPNEFSIDDLMSKGTYGEYWDGVRNYQARNFMREMRFGDSVFIYHSACAEPAIVGLATVVEEAIEDPSALDPSSHYFDPKSSTDNNRWSIVRVAFQEKFPNPLSLKAIKGEPSLAEMLLVKRSRLSVSPVTQEEQAILFSLLKR